MDQNFVLKGTICYSKDLANLEIVTGGYLVCINGKSAGVFSSLPEQYRALPLTDYGDKLIVPGLTDLHIHAPQFAFRSLGMDLELLEWLETHTFPQEAKYADLDYAKRAYTLFVEDIRRGPNTRAAVFATLHLPATQLLMDLLEDSGLVTMVGKVNMDRNSPNYLREQSADQSAQSTRDWLAACDGRYQNTYPILTPRFIPTCSDALMGMIGDIQRESGLPVQSHLSENNSEVAWVQELCPLAKCYGDAYDQFGLFGNQAPTIMAHCVWCTGEEIARMRDNRVFVAHCPQSNANLSSGIAPVRRYLQEGIPVGLGSDMAGGCHSSIFRAMSDAIQVSKLRWRLVDQSLPPLTLAEAFYLGTVGGGAFFGKVGSFALDYEFDALVLDDSNLAAPYSLSPEDRLARIVYNADDRNIAAKYVRGVALF